MRNFLLENFWIWLVLAFFIAVIGFIVFTHKRDLRLLGGSVLGSVLVLALGAVLVWGVPTDRKLIVRSLDETIAAVKDDKINDVLVHVAQGSPVERIARAGMIAFRVEKASYSDLKITIDRMTAPPTAKLTFTAFAQVRGKLTGEGPFPTRIKFNVEMERSPSGWVISHCTFDPHGGLL